ncbi:MAG: ABC transporter ATP-binding protein [Proteobacteria bacterium]|nr:ABC transporter ATP-binding protein [Pseudomonadota bacterium]
MNPNISFGTLNTVVSGEMLSMQTVIPQAFLDFIVAVTSLTLTSLFLLFIDWRLSLVTIAVIPAVAPFYLWQKNVLARGLRKRSDSLAMLNCEVIEYVEGMEVLKAFKQTGKQFKKLAGSSKNSRTSI